MNGTGETDQELAGRLAKEAGELLCALREEAGDLDQTALRALGDRHSHEFLVGELVRSRPQDAVLSEESHRVDRSPVDGRVWIVDPLDGTREFGEPGRTDWAVHVALLAKDGLVAGAVALPARNLVFTTENAPTSGGGSAGRTRLAVSRTRPPAFATALATALDAEPVPMGSAGVKIVSVLLGDTDMYVHAGGQYEWDSAAPVAVARAAGLHTSRIDGSPLVYGSGDAWLPDLLVCHPQDAERVLATIRTVGLPTVAREG